MKTEIKISEEDLAKIIYEWEREQPYFPKNKIGWEKLEWNRRLTYLHKAEVFQMILTEIEKQFPMEKEKE